MENWKKYYPLPIENDDLCFYAWANNRTMVLMFAEDIEDDVREKICDSINGKGNYKIPNLKTDGIDFYDGKKYIFCVRGWGYLTGTGACNLSTKKAEKIQDAFKEHIYKSLNQ